VRDGQSGVDGVTPYCERVPEKRKSLQRAVRLRTAKRRQDEYREVG
jgi:hypothetical protein